MDTRKLAERLAEWFMYLVFAVFTIVVLALAVRLAMWILGL